MVQGVGDGFKIVGRIPLKLGGLIKGVGYRGDPVQGIIGKPGFVAFRVFVPLKMPF